MTQFYPIRLVRMMTGEVLITGISDGGKESYVFERPMGIFVMQSQSQNQLPDEKIQEMTIVLREWMEFTDDNYIIVPKRSVMCIMKPNKQIVSDYTQAKIQSDIMDDMVENGMIQGKTVQQLEEEDDDDDLEIDPGEPEGYDEFPGWGGDPRL